MTGFYVALNEDNGAGMAGFSPEAVLRTLSGLRIRSPGKRSATGGAYTTRQNPAPWDGVLFKRKNKKPGLSTELSALFDAGSLWRASCHHPPGRCCNCSNPLPAVCLSSGERSPTDNRQNKEPGLSTGLSALFDAWQFPTLTWGDPTLPSALRRFTSEFGMGSGGTTALVPPANSVYQHVLRTHRLICIEAKIFSQIRQNIFGVVG